MAYRIYTDATADMHEQEELLCGLPPLEIIPMKVEMGGKEYMIGRNGDISTGKFYKIYREEKKALTSQINVCDYCNAFEKSLSAGLDVIYFCFSSGMSGTMQSAKIAADELAEKYPERKIAVIDTLGATVGIAILVCEALAKQQAGADFDEIKAWAEQSAHKICYWFTVDDLQYLVYGGRLSAVSAAVGTMLNVRPILHVDEDGKLAVREKIRGEKKLIDTFVKKLESLDKNGSELVFIGYGDNYEKADMIRSKLMEKYPDINIRLGQIGAVIGAHAGPGVLALIYWGDNR